MPVANEQRPLLDASPVPKATETQEDFNALGELHTLLAPHQRVGAWDAVKLETTGVIPQIHNLELLNLKLVQKESIAAKLRSIGCMDLVTPLAECHTQESFAQCQGCRKLRHFWNRCENFYCPVCQPTLARERFDSLEWWTHEVTQPKHVVLTIRNTNTLTFSQVKWFKRCLVRLRRSTFARNWLGGLWSLEVTNEDRGWHLHAHLLVEAKWIDPRELSAKWAKIVGQDFAIVKVKDARRSEYLKEVCKYAVKGTELARWKPEDIATFIYAFHGQRTFGVFGCLYGKRTQWSEWIKATCADRSKCECGCNHWKVYTADEWQWKQETAWTPSATIPPPAQPAPELALPL